MARCIFGPIVLVVLALDVGCGSGVKSAGGPDGLSVDANLDSFLDEGSIDTPPSEPNDALPSDADIDVGLDPCATCGVNSTCFFGACTVPCSPVGTLDSCKDALTCIDACPTDSNFAACRGMCISNLGENGLGAFQKLAQCASTSCQTDDDAPWDNDCLLANCADDVAGCAWGCTFEDCASLWSCIEVCSTVTDSQGLSKCHQSCAQEALTTAQVSLLRVIECGLLACNDECEMSGDLACLTCLEATAESSCADEWTVCQGH